MTEKQFLDFNERNRAVILVFIIRGLVKIIDDKSGKFCQKMLKKYKMKEEEKQAVRTQKEIIRDELLRNNETTNWDVIQKYKITRLSEYIRQLRKDGMNIFSKYEKDDLTGTTYVRYILLKPNSNTRGDELE